MADLAQLLQPQTQGAPPPPQSTVAQALQPADPVRQQPVGPQTGASQMQQQYAQLYNDWVETLNQVSNDPDALTGLMVMMNHAAQPRQGLSTAAHLSNATISGRQQMAREQGVKQKLLQMKSNMLKTQMEQMLARQNANSQQMQAESGQVRADASALKAEQAALRTPAINRYQDRTGRAALLNAQRGTDKRGTTQVYAEKIAEALMRLDPGINKDQALLKAVQLTKQLGEKSRRQMMGDLLQERQIFMRDEESIQEQTNIVNSLLDIMYGPEQSAQTAGNVNAPAGLKYGDIRPGQGGTKWRFIGQGPSEQFDRTKWEPVSQGSAAPGF